MKTLTLTVIAGLFLAGCASSKYSSNEEPTIQVKVPSWYMTQPKKDDSIFASGTAASRDLQLSYDMAIMNAKANLADRVNSKISSQTKNFQAQVGTNDKMTTRQELEKASKNVVTDVDVSGYSVVKNETVQTGGVFRTFVLLEYSDATATELMVNRVNREGIISGITNSQRAFKELDKEIDKKR